SRHRYCSGKDVSPPTIRSGDAARITTIALAVVAAAALLWTVRAFVLVFFFGLLLALPLGSAAGFLHRRFRVRRGLAVVAMVLLVLGLMVGSAFLLAGPIATQYGEIRDTLPQAIDRVEEWLDRAPFLERVVLGGEEVAEAEKDTQAPEQEESASMRNRLASQLRDHAGILFPFVMSTVTAISGVLLVLFLVIYLAANPQLYRDGLLRLVPRDRREKTAAVGDEVASTLNRWLAAQGVSMLVIGIISTIGLLLLDVRAAVALGVLAGISEFIPVFGPILSAIPAIAIAFVDSPTKALYVLILYIAIQQVESNIVTPLVMKHGVDVPPVVTIIAGTIMTILFGFLGLLVAVPVAAALLTIGRELTEPLD
ncbi:MAG TPA: AI-2E family transporter, partial [Thermoanaerobaculia bacterium]|nr:AI-2E family transporter [Thermoanaerobaculia bacterium]